MLMSFIGIEHRLKGDETREAWNQAGKDGFQKAAADARVTGEDDETVFIGIEHRLQGHDAQEAWSQAGKTGFQEACTIQ